MESQSSSPMDRIKVLAGHFNNNLSPHQTPLRQSHCLAYSPPELSEPIDFDTKSMRQLMDGKFVQDIDWLFGIIAQSELFGRIERAGKVFVSPDYNTTMEQQREITMRRIAYFKEHGLFEGWFTPKGQDAELRNFAFTEVVSLYDHSLSIKMGVHFYLCNMNPG